MAIDVIMPQMGESIAEGTVVRWIKKPGEKVERDEPLLEISTDKVDAEIPSPAQPQPHEAVSALAQDRGGKQRQHPADPGLRLPGGSDEKQHSRGNAAAGGAKARRSTRIQGRVQVRRVDPPRAALGDA